MKKKHLKKLAKKLGLKVKIVKFKKRDAADYRGLPVFIPESTDRSDLPVWATPRTYEDIFGEPS